MKIMTLLLFAISISAVSGDILYTGNTSFAVTPVSSINMDGEAAIVVPEYSYYRLRVYTKTGALKWTLKLSLLPSRVDIVTSDKVLITYSEVSGYTPTSGSRTYIQTATGAQWASPAGSYGFQMSQGRNRFAIKSKRNNSEYVDVYDMNGNRLIEIDLRKSWSLNPPKSDVPEPAPEFDGRMLSFSQDGNGLFIFPSEETSSQIIENYRVGVSTPMFIKVAEGMLVQSAAPLSSTSFVFIDNKGAIRKMEGSTVAFEKFSDRPGSIHSNGTVTDDIYHSIESSPNGQYFFAKAGSGFDVYSSTGALLWTFFPEVDSENLGLALKLDQITSSIPLPQRAYSLTPYWAENTLLLGYSDSSQVVKIDNLTNISGSVRHGQRPAPLLTGYPNIHTWNLYNTQTGITRDRITFVTPN